MYLLIAILYTQQVATKILIITTAFNRPDFIEFQHKTFKKFLKEDYIFKVFNDAIDPNLEKQICEICSKYNIECIRVPQNLHNIDPNCGRAPASFRHGESMQFAFDNYGFAHDDIVMLIDSDVFLTHELSIIDFLEGKDAYLLVGHFKPQLCFLNMPKLNNPRSINFRAGVLNGNFMDAGHYTYDYIRAHPELKVKHGTLVWGLYRNAPTDLEINRHASVDSQLKPKGFTDLEIKLVQSLVNVCNSGGNKACNDTDIAFYETNLFLDYKHGSDWHGPNPYFKQQKDRIIKEFFDELLK